MAVAIDYIGIFDNCVGCCVTAAPVSIEDSVINTVRLMLWVWQQKQKCL